MPNPTPEQIRQARESAGLSTAEASALVHRTQRNWQQWESGSRPVDLAAWELFTIKILRSKLERHHEFKSGNHEA